jgi:thymidine kinase
VKGSGFMFCLDAYFPYIAIKIRSFTVRPHAQHLDGLLYWQHFAHQTVLHVDAFRAKIANLKIAIFKPSLDIRYHENMIVSHNENILDAKPVADPIEILNQVDEAYVVGIDEAQFFNEKITSVCESLAGMGKRVILAGLDMDYLGKPFGPMPDLLAPANYVTKLHAVCVKCGGTASYSFRISDENDQVVLGEKQHYEARCRSCHKL